MEGTFVPLNGHHLAIIDKAMAAIANLHFTRPAYIFIMLTRSLKERRHRRVAVARFLERGE